jgi:single-strand DNA-binding protein
MNNVQLIGRITAPPELRHTQGGTAVAETSIAVDDGYKENKKTFFFRLVFWDKKAEAASQHLVKGQRIGVTGKLTQEKFTPKGSDKEETKTRIQVFDFDFLDKPQGHDGGGQQRQDPSAANRPAESPDDEEDDVPF